jgi:glycolate oxidase FAD binding subunit
MQIAEPQSPEELAGVLAAASRERRTVVLRGGATKLDWARPAPEPDLSVAMTRLNRLIAHRHGDLTATVQAGTTLADFNRELGRYRQWLPVESAFDGATIGGVVATNDCGPLRHRSGTPRDLLIGITLALTDGRIVKAGGHVVKNVAGYDLGKLVSGSFGALAATVDATFKLMPWPQASATLAVTYDNPAALARDAAAVAASQLEPAAFDVAANSSAYQLLVKFASSPAATDAQVDAATTLVSGDVRVVRDEAETEAWRAQVRDPWSGPTSSTVVRMSWLPSKLVDVLSLIRGHAFAGRVMGSGLVRLEGDAATHATIVEGLRRSSDVRHVVLLKASAALKQQVDVWGEPPSSFGATRALKQMFDPAGILNTGRGPV